MTKELLVKQYELVQALKLVALPYQDQVRALPSHVVVADEIALTFGDAYDTCKAALDAGSLFPRNIVMMLVAIEQSFATMSEDPSMWSTCALEQEVAWHKQRTLAGEVLVLMGEVPGSWPDGSNHHYV